MRHMKSCVSVSFRMEKQLGADVKLRTMEWKTYLGERNMGNFQLSRMCQLMRNIMSHQHFLIH